MKQLIIFLILITIFSNLHAQISAYNANGKKMNCIAEDFDIVDITVSSVAIPKSTNRQGRMELSLAPAIVGAAAAVIPAIVNGGIKFIDSLLAKNVRKFEAEYIHSKSYLNACSDTMPDFSIERRIWRNNVDSVDGEIALKMDFKAYSIPNISWAMVYYIDSYELNYTKAKIKKCKNDHPDYSIVFEFVFIDKDGNRFVQSIEPVNIRSLRFGKKRDVSKDYKYRTDFIILPDNACLTKISVKIVETNPRKISAEKVLENWKSYNEYAKTGVDALLAEGLKALNDKAEEDLWKTAIQTNTEEAYQKYLNNTTKGTYKNEANKKINSLKDNNTSVGNN